jgi:hypothetical protein
VWEITTAINPNIDVSVFSLHCSFVDIKSDFSGLQDKAQYNWGQTKSTGTNTTDGGK